MSIICGVLQVLRAYMPLALVTVTSLVRLALLVVFGQGSRVFSFLVSYLTCISHPHGLAQSEVVIFVRGQLPSLNTKIRSSLAHSRKNRNTYL